MTTSSRPIIGIAGTFASGQDSAGKYFAEHYDYLYVSTSDIVREEAMKRHGSIERPVLFETAMALRHEQGGGVLALLALEKYRALHQEYKGVAITGIRSLGEVKAVKDASGIILFTDAPIDLRYSRMKDRNRDGEVGISFEAFREREEREATTGNTDEDFNREAIRQIADHQIKNDASFEYFCLQLDAVLK